MLIAYAPGAPTGGLWVMNANGTLRHRIIRGSGDVLFPTWSTNAAGFFNSLPAWQRVR